MRGATGGGDAVSLLPGDSPLTTRERALVGLVLLGLALALCYLAAFLFG